MTVVPSVVTMQWLRWQRGTMPNLQQITFSHLCYLEGHNYSSGEGPDENIIIRKRNFTKDIIGLLQKKSTIEYAEGFNDVGGD